MEGGELNGVKITRIHLEEDTGRLIHAKDETSSLVDFNRAGVPLMELGNRAGYFSGEQARKFAEELQLILRYLDISDADMEKGQMRVEVNISLSENISVGKAGKLTSLRTDEEEILRRPNFPAFLRKTRHQSGNKKSQFFSFGGTVCKLRDRKADGGFGSGRKSKTRDKGLGRRERKKLFPREEKKWPTITDIFPSRICRR